METITLLIGVPGACMLGLFFGAALWKFNKYLFGEDKLWKKIAGENDLLKRALYKLKTDLAAQKVQLCKIERENKFLRSKLKDLS